MGRLIQIPGVLAQSSPHRCAVPCAITPRWRLRFGDYRVVYTVEDGQLIVWVPAVGNHRDIYRQVP
jgi:hypothetical protein